MVKFLYKIGNKFMTETITELHPLVSILASMVTISGIFGGIVKIIIYQSNKKLESKIWNDMSKELDKRFDKILNNIADIARENREHREKIVKSSEELAKNYLTKDEHHQICTRNTEWITRELDRAKNGK